MTKNITVISICSGAGTTVTLNYELAPVCSQFPLFKCTVKSFVNIITKSGSVI